MTSPIYDVTYLWRQNNLKVYFSETPYGNKFLNFSKTKELVKKENQNTFDIKKRTKTNIYDVDECLKYWRMQLE